MRSLSIPLLALALTSLAALAACNNGTSSPGAAGSGTAGAPGQGASGSDAAGPGAGGSSAAGAGAAGSAGISGTSGHGGNPGTAGSGAGTPAPLGPTTLVFERKVSGDSDHLVALDYATGDSHVLATLAEGSVAGWKIDGVSVSPDRTRLVLASPYGATASDVATGLSTNALWSLDTTGGDFRRLTPTFANPHPGQPGFWIDVRNPLFTPDGQQVLFDHGEGSANGGYVAPWYVDASGSAPSLLDLPKSKNCSVNSNLAFQPTTGDLLVLHDLCTSDEPAGYFLYPHDGGEPRYLIDAKGVSYSGEAPSFSPDGTVFVYTARTYSDSVQSLFVYLMKQQTVAPLVPGAEGRDIVNAAFAPDNAHLVYCDRQGSAYNLHLVDLLASPPTDVPLTTDGVSCDPVF